MAINPFAAGTDALFDYLAEREERRMLMEDRERRAQLDREAKEKSDAQLALQRDQLGSLERDRQERAAATKRDDDRAAADQKAIDDHIAIVMDPTKTEAERRAAGMWLDQKNVDPNRIERAITGKDPTKKVHVVDANGRVVRTIEMGMQDQYQELPRPAAGPQTPVSHRDDPSIPDGTKRWLDTIAARGVDEDTAMAELNKGWNQQLAAHPRAELASAAAYLKKFYGNGGGAFEGNTQPSGGAPPAVGAAADPNAALAADPENAEAVAKLKEMGKEVSPTTIRMAKAAIAEERANPDLRGELDDFNRGGPSAVQLDPTQDLDPFNRSEARVRSAVGPVVRLQKGLEKRDVPIAEAQKLIAEGWRLTR